MAVFVVYTEITQSVGAASASAKYEVRSGTATAFEVLDRNTTTVDLPPASTTTRKDVAVAFDTRAQELKAAAEKALADYSPALNQLVGVKFPLPANSPILS